MKRPLVIGSLAALTVWALSSSLFTVSEATQALIVRLGKRIGVIVEPGLQTKLPFIDSVIAFDTRLLLLDPKLNGDQPRDATAFPSLHGELPSGAAHMGGFST